MERETSAPAHWAPLVRAEESEQENECRPPMEALRSRFCSTEDWLFGVAPGSASDLAELAGEKKSVGEKNPFCKCCKEFGEGDWEAERGRG